MRTRESLSLATLVVACALAVGCGQSDAGTTAAVKSKLVGDDTVKASNIDVDTKDHVVTLRGTVASEEAHKRAVALARQTDGVKNVVDQLDVQASRPETLPAAGRTEPEATADQGNQGKESRHVVRRGETLGTIAREELGDSGRWRELYDANRGVLSDPNHLRVGTDLKIPKK